ncbi:MAG TPA: NADP-dependent oxidoreductase [Magnetospirillaceae bacterium]|jgi:NADPH:quinone reductase-like Zn-dependent oxidoreductase
MKAVRIHHFGGPEVLEFEDVAVPHPKADEILVKVHAASMNPVDYKTREGHFAVVSEDKLPVTLGRDIAGTVEACGTAVHDFQDGDPIFALLPADRGGYAEYVAFKATDAAPMPRTLNFAMAASVPLAAMTAWQGLIDHGKMKSGEKVLVHGGAGGVGHFAIQIAKAHGCKVYTTVSNRDLAFVRGIGADEVIDYHAERFEDRVVGIDLVLDLVGGDTQKRSYSVVKFGGRLISTLMEPERELCKRLGIHGAHYMTAPNAGELREIGKLIDKKKIRPIVSGMLPLTEVRVGQEILAHEHPFGKLVLQLAS